MPIPGHCSCKNRDCELTKPLHSNLCPVELCAFACLGALNHDRPIVDAPDLALWRYCWRCWAKVSGRSMKKLSFSRHEAFIIEQEIMLASLGSVWFDEVTHPHKGSSCRKMFNDQITLIITHLLLHLLPLNAHLGPVFLDQPRDWPCIGTPNSTKLRNMGM